MGKIPTCLQLNITENSPVIRNVKHVLDICSPLVSRLAGDANGYQCKNDGEIISKISKPFPSYAFAHCSPVWILFQINVLYREGHTLLILRTAQQ